MLIRRGAAPTLDCINDRNCSMGYYNRLNEKSLKTLVVGGDYTLWIYERLDERNFAAVPCIPFSLNLAIANEMVKENFINCEALRMPAVLTPDIYEQPSGVVHFREAVLVELEKSQHLVNFTTDVDSFFRIALSPHRIDIDLKLFAANGTQLEYSGQWGGEDAIARLLPPGSYYAAIIYFGINDPQFCETFDVEIALAPRSLYPSFDYCLTSGQAKNTKPDLSGLPPVNRTFILEDPRSYYFPYNGNYNQQVLNRISQLPWNLFLKLRWAITSCWMIWRFR